MAFAAGALVVALFTKDVSNNMTKHVAVRLENEAGPSSEKVKDVA